MKQFIQDVPLLYESYATGTPIILLHGAGWDHRFMIACMEPLFARRLGWQGIYLDLPSMGQPQHGGHQEQR